MNLHDGTKFNRDYYEDGIKNHLSGYENFRWIPTRSYPEAVSIINTFDFNSVIDYGCAKGFLVHALRQLGKEAYGEDISDYAIENCEKRVKQFISKPSNNTADLLICKDVLEHVPEDKIDATLDFLKNKFKKQSFFVIPLGDNDVFRIREYSMDQTHVLMKDEDWWIDKFKQHNFRLVRFDYSLGAIKEKWVEQYPYGNGFFTFEKKGE